MNHLCRFPVVSVCLAMAIPACDSRSLGGTDGGAGPNDGSAPAASKRVVWKKLVGGPAQDRATSVVADRQGNVYVAGYYNGALEPGDGYRVSSIFGQDIYLLSLTPEGTVRWATGVEGSGKWDEPRDLAIDAQGNLYLTGYFDGTITVGATRLESAGGSDILVASFDSSGKPRWAVSRGEAQRDEGVGVAADRRGNVYVAGFIGGGMTSWGKIVVESFSPTGDSRWIKTTAATAHPLLRVAVSAAEEVFLAGGFSGTLDLGGAPLHFQPSGTNLPVTFVACLRGDGTHLWSKQYGGTQVDDLALSPRRGLYLLSWTATGGQSLASLDASGTHRWSAAVGNAGLVSIAAGEQGIYAAGALWDSIDLGGGRLTPAGEKRVEGPIGPIYPPDVLVAAFAGTGAHVWSERFGDAEFDVASDVALAPDGHLYVVGELMRTLPEQRPSWMPDSPGKLDIESFVMKLRP
jgi:hypothetical protein